MWRQILVTGATGALGTPLVAALLRARCAERIGLLIRDGAATAEDRFCRLVASLEELRLPIRPLFLLAGDLSDVGRLGAALCHDAEVIVHAAADTNFRSPPALQDRVNVGGTQALIDWARCRQRLSHLVLVSTTCVAGRRVGKIAETAAANPPDFVNHYERTKWHAEGIALRSGLPTRLVRLSTCAGSEEDGAVGRYGALHHSLHWLYRGLVPIVPGSPSTPIDFVSTNAAVAFLARAVNEPFSGSETFHVAAGSRAVPLEELLDFLATRFAKTHAGWRRGQVTRSVIVGAEAFAAFRRSVEQSRDVVLGQVMAATDAFLPALLYPKTYETRNAEKFWGGPLPLPDWRQLIERVVENCLQNNWGRPLSRELQHVG
jgi:nucleoside-diphosphate-sugar epimerase